MKDAGKGPIKWDKDKIVAALRERALQGLALNAGAIVKSDWALSHAIYGHFGSHDEALRAAGVDPDAVRLRGRPWDKGRIIAALRERRDKGLGVNAGAVHGSDPGLGNAIRKHFPSHDAALDAAGLDAASVRMWRPWDKPGVLAAIRERHAQGGDMRPSALRESAPALQSAISRHFGTYRACLQAAGIDPPELRRREPWTEARVVAALRDRSSRRLELNYVAIAKSDVPLSEAIRRCFGSHDDALRAAGIDPGTARKHVSWDKSLVLAGLRERAAKGLWLNHKAVERSDPRLVEAARTHFGSYGAALREIGVHPDSVRKRVAWNKDKIIAAVRDRDQRGLEMRAGAVQKSDAALAGAMRVHFGSHDAALAAAGIDPDTVHRPRPRWTDEKVIDTLRSLARDGSVPWPLAKTGGTGIQDAARYLFGSIKAAAEAAGLRYERPVVGVVGEIGHWTEALVLQTLRDLHQGGHDLRHRPMKERNQPLFFAAQRFFGSYVNAVRQAGIDYWQMSQAHLARDRAAATTSSDDSLAR